jgi:hypothetical protein
VRSEAELDADWSIDDVAIAHELLDELDFVEAKARREAKQEAERRTGRR